MIRTLIWYVYFWLYAVYSIILLIKLNKLTKQNKTKEAEKLIFEATKKWGRRLIKLSGSTVEVIGTENIPDENVLFVSNHQGDFDIPILLGYLNKPVGFIAKVELKKVPIISIWMEKINCVFIDRKSPRKSLEAILQAAKLLKKGKSLVIFPEGTRSGSQKLRNFKPGSLKLAIKAKVPIVPVTINGSYKIKKPDSLKIRPAHVTVTISPPVFVDKLSKKEQADLADKIREVIATKALLNNNK